MEYVKASKLEEIKLSGVEVVSVERNTSDSFVSVHLKDKDGKEVIFRQGQLYSLDVFIQRPPKFEKNWVVKTKKPGILFQGIFDSEIEARDAAAEAFGVMNFDTKLKDLCDFVQEEVQVS